MPCSSACARSLGRRGPGATEARNAVQARLAAPPPGLIPARADLNLEGRIQLFTAEAEAVQAGVRRLRRYDDLPDAIERYLRERNLPMRLVDGERSAARPGQLVSGPC